MRTGYIYVITNLINGKQYVGQTSRSVEIRFDEHCYDKRSTSAIHAAIAKYGVKNFTVAVLETPPLEKLDEREKYWIEKLNTFQNGYNQTVGGNNNLSVAHMHCKIVENNLTFDSKEDCARLMSQLTSWNLTFLRQKLASIIDTDKTFCNFHLITVPFEEPVSDILDLENWIKTLNMQFQGKRILCINTEQEFETIGEAAKYYVDNKIYQGSSKYPIQSLITTIGYNLKGKTDCVETLGGLQFTYLPGTTKNEGGDFVKKTIYCPELNLTFESGIAAAKYFIDNKIWTNIVFKTAKLRISDVIRGVFPDYKGYHFQAIQNNENIDKEKNS